jgi:peptide/nickel transport system substrate-binding protein
VLSNLLAGEIQFATDRTVRFEQAQTLKREWSPNQGGTAILTPAQPRYLAVQHRPDFATPRALTDVRARRALAHAVDRQALNDGLFDGEGAPTETMITPFFQGYQEVDRAITKYPHDPRRVEQLMNEIGYAKGADGTFASGGDRFALPFLQEAGNQTEREMAILIDTWRRLGIETRPTVMASTQLRDYEIRATFPGVYSTAMGGALEGGTRNLINHISSSIGTPANRWQGQNYSGWSNGEYDRLYDAFTSTLDPAERQRQAVQMAKLVSDDAAFIMLFFNFNVSAHSAAVRGPDPKAFDTLVNWNIHEWEMR